MAIILGILHNTTDRKYLTKRIHNENDNYKRLFSFQLSKLSRPVTGLLLFLDGFCNFMQNLLAFKMISMVQPLTYSVFNAFKRVAVILVSVAIFKNPVSAINFFGMGLAIFGVWTYSKVSWTHFDSRVLQGMQCFVSNLNRFSTYKKEKSYYLSRSKL